ISTLSLPDALPIWVQIDTTQARETKDRRHSGVPPSRPLACPLNRRYRSDRSGHPSELLPSHPAPPSLSNPADPVPPLHLQSPLERVSVDVSATPVFRYLATYIE